MRQSLLALSSFTVALLALCSFVIAYFAFSFVHPWVMDGLGDVREMMGDGPRPSWWYSFLHGGWFTSYLPAVALGVFGLWLSAISVALFRSRGPHSTSPNDNTRNA